MTYAGIPKKYAEEEFAKIVLITVPYDGTSTLGKGADKGPRAFLEASENMEMYDIETDSEVYQKGIFLAPTITENRSPEAMVGAVYHAVKHYLSKKKFVTLFGGEHSISIGSLRAFNECFDKLTVIQIDAHADLRQEYKGSVYNHACAVHEASKASNLIQVGIRSMDASEKKYMNYDQCYFAHKIQNSSNWIDKVIEQCTEHIFITIDLDAFDPSIMPSTGTPEPGGMDWYTVLSFLKRLTVAKNIVGFDITELCPNEHNRAPDFLAAKLYYKLLSYKFST